ncbi:MAG: sigma-70 family RNA polymerase sigma factor [Bacteroidota bacterium]
MNEHFDHIQAIAQGDRKAFKMLYEIFSNKVYNTAISYVHNEPEAEEITQDVFTKVFRYAAKFKGESTVNTWIYRITVNTALNYLKKRKRAAFTTLQEQESQRPDFEHPGVVLENKEKASFLFKAIETLPESQKTAFILAFIEGLPRQEVAQIMDSSLKAIESLLQRAKKNLRGKLEHFYPHQRKS